MAKFCQKRIQIRRVRLISQKKSKYYEKFTRAGIYIDETATIPAPPPWFNHHVWSFIVWVDRKKYEKSGRKRGEIIRDMSEMLSQIKEDKIKIKFQNAAWRR